MEFEIDKFKTQGIKINYYYVCKRKLWLYSKGITMEQDNDRVLSGKLVHQDSYERKKNKELLIDDVLKLDIVEGDYVREVKISSKMEKASKMQLLYYLFYLKQLGINKKGTINYVKEKKVERVELTHETESEIKNALVDIKNIVNSKVPPKVIGKKYCKKCAYYHFCYVREDD